MALWEQMTAVVAAQQAAHPHCTICGCSITEDDLCAYAEEANDPRAIPDVCSDCAEIAAIDARTRRHAQ